GAHSFKAACLCGMVTLTPRKPCVGACWMKLPSSSGATACAVYSPARPSACNAAVCIAGDFDCATGQPITPSFIMVAPLSHPRPVAALELRRLDRRVRVANEPRERRRLARPRRGDAHRRRHHELDAARAQPAVADLVDDASSHRL